MPDVPTPEQSFSIHLKSLTDFADEFTTQIESIQAPMDHLATMAATAPQYGAFAEAWSLGAGEQAAIEEMYSLLGQVKQAIAFAGSVTGTVAEGYKHADEDISSALGGAPPLGSGHHESNHPVQGHQGGYSWQNAQVDTDKVVFPAPGAPAGPPMPGAPMTAPPVTDVSSASVSHLVTGAVAGGPLPVWTPPPDPAVAPLPAPAPDPRFPGPDPSWTDYFQGIPQGGA